MTRARKIVLGILVLFLVIQFMPKGLFPLSNPQAEESRGIQASAKTLKPEIHGVLRRACYDCHSNTTVWPWYSKVAPISWLLSHDVAEGRRELNFSQWADYSLKRQDRKLTEVCEQVQRGEMPVWYYKPMHPQANLSEQDKTAICVWTREEKAALATMATK